MPLTNVNPGSKHAENCFYSSLGTCPEQPSKLRIFLMEQTFKQPLVVPFPVDGR
jgi:hypothetical protein